MTRFFKLTKERARDSMQQRAIQQLSTTYVFVISRPPVQIRASAPPCNSRITPAWQGLSACPASTWKTRGPDRCGSARLRQSPGALGRGGDARRGFVRCQDWACLVPDLQPLAAWTRRRTDGARAESCNVSAES